MSEYPKGWQVVGENGPEIIDLKSAGSVMTVAEVREYMRNYGKSKDEDNEPHNTQTHHLQPRIRHPRDRP